MRVQCRGAVRACALRHVPCLTPSRTAGVLISACGPVPARPVAVRLVPVWPVCRNSLRTFTTHPGIFRCAIIRATATATPAGSPLTAYRRGPAWGEVSTAASR